MNSSTADENLGIENLSRLCGKPNVEVTGVAQHNELQARVAELILSLDPSTYKTVELSRGYKAIVDAELFAVAQNYSWFAVGAEGSNYIYARSSQIKPGKHIGLANFVLTLHHGLKVSDPIRHVTHNNKITLDCRVKNLLNNSGRQAVMRNRKGKRNASSQYKGVRLIGGRWRAEIYDGHSRISLGAYEKEIDAALIYDAAAFMIFGASAFYNLPIGTPTQKHRIEAQIRISKSYAKRKMNLPDNVIDI